MYLLQADEIFYFPTQKWHERRKCFLFINSDVMFRRKFFFFFFCSKNVITNSQIVDIGMDICIDLKCVLKELHVGLIFNKECKSELLLKSSCKMQVST